MTCVTCCTSPGTDTAGADASSSPGMIWEERFALEKETQQLMNSTPLMRLEGGVLKLDVSQMERISNSKCSDILQRFKDALRSIGIGESKSTSLDSTPSDLRVGGVGNKRPHRAETERAMNVPLRIPSDNTDWTTTAPSYKKQKVSKPVESVVPTELNEEAKQSSDSYDYLSKCVDFMTVPIGSSGSDRITLYDKSQRMLTRAYIDVPKNAYSGMQMNRVQPSSDFKLLLVDGDGFKVGGTTAVQHAARLHVHRCKCMNAECNVLGCGSDPSFNLFKDAANPDVVKEYARHWASSNRQALKAHGQSLRMRAGETR